MENLLYFIVSIITRIHNYVLSLNDGIEYSFTDKELHFIVIGIVGIGLVFIIHPIFRMLANGDHILTISFIYVFTLIIVITFAIEIGQGYSHTGSMDFGDIVTRYSRPNIESDTAEADDFKKKKLKYAEKFTQWIIDNENVDVINLCK